jgi:hypothetical protein
MGNHERLYRHHSKVCYILGAGFSYPAGVPLLRDFVPSAFRVLKGSKRDQHLADRLASLLEKYARIAHAVQIDLENLEDLFCLVDLPSGTQAKETESSDEKDRATLKEVIVRTAGLTGKYFRKSDQDPGSLLVSRAHLFPTLGPIRVRCMPRESLDVTLYEAFLSYLLHNNNEEKREVKDQYDLDTIISLNYDLVIEDVIQCFEGAGVYYGDGVLRNKSVEMADIWKERVFLELPRENLRVAIPLLKLHGSVNWYCDLDNNSTERVFREVTRLLDPAALQDSNAYAEFFKNIPLIPPTWNKQASEITIFASMVEQAIHHLRRAAKIVVIGYSMPESDVHFRYMLAKGLCTPESPKIEVWDVRPRHEMQGCLKRMFGSQNLDKKRVVYESTGLRGFVESHSHDESLRMT